MLNRRSSLLLLKWDIDQSLNFLLWITFWSLHLNLDYLTLELILSILFGYVCENSVIFSYQAFTWVIADTLIIISHVAFYVIAFVPVFAAAIVITAGFTTCTTVILTLIFAFNYFVNNRSSILTDASVTTTISLDLNIHKGMNSTTQIKAVTIS